MSNEWRTSSYSQNGGQCVEVREHADTVELRDTQNRKAATLAFPATEWAALLASESDISVR